MDYQGQLTLVTSVEVFSRLHSARKPDCTYNLSDVFIFSPPVFYMLKSAVSLSLARKQL